MYSTKSANIKKIQWGSCLPDPRNLDSSKFQIFIFLFRTAKLSGIRTFLVRSWVECQAKNVRTKTPDFGRVWCHFEFENVWNQTFCLDFGPWAENSGDLKSGRVWISNGQKEIGLQMVKKKLGYKWSGFQVGSKILTNDLHFVKNYLKHRLKCPDFKWSSFWMVLDLSYS